MLRITVADEGHSHTKHEITETKTRFTPQLQESRHDSRHNYMNHATISRFTPQLYESRHNYTFTPQSQESRHKETADQSWA